MKFFFLILNIFIFSPISSPLISAGLNKPFKSLTISTSSATATEHTFPNFPIRLSSYCYSGTILGIWHPHFPAKTPSSFSSRIHSGRRILILILPRNPYHRPSTITIQLPKALRVPVDTPQQSTGNYHFEEKTYNKSNHVPPILHSLRMVSMWRRCRQQRLRCPPPERLPGCQYRDRAYALLLQLTCHAWLQVREGDPQEGT